MSPILKKTLIATAVGILVVLAVVGVFWVRSRGSGTVTGPSTGGSPADVSANPTGEVGEPYQGVVVQEKNGSRRMLNTEEKAARGFPDSWQVEMQISDEGLISLNTLSGPEPDGDGDGLLDREEAVKGTDPKGNDTDKDGLYDGDEVNTYQTDPRNPDTDNDGGTDGDEVASKRDPLDPAK